MTLDEAIEDLTKLKRFCEKTNWKTHAISIGIGIEALKRVQDLRKERGLKSCYLLPGETEE